MTEIPMRVYILTHIVPTSKTVKWSGVVESPFDLEALKQASEFRDWLANNIVPYGQSFFCSIHHTGVGVQSRSIICLHTPWPALSQQVGVTLRAARGEIVEAIDDIIYTGPDTMFILQNEVLVGLFLYDDGIEVPDLDFGINHRLTRWARQELEGLGYNRRSADHIISIFLSDAWRIPPKDWVWDDLRTQLHSVANSYNADLHQEPAAWYVYERLAGGNVDEPPFLSSANVEEFVEALIDEPGKGHEWLVRASPLLAAFYLGDPERESLRQVDADEMFSSRRGVVWFHAGQPIWLGEVAGALLMERHGHVVTNADVQAREHLVGVLVERVTARIVCDDMFESVVQTAHDMIEENDPLQLWYHEVDVLVDRVIERASATLP